MQTDILHVLKEGNGQNRPIDSPTDWQAERLVLATLRAFNQRFFSQIRMKYESALAITPNIAKLH